MSKTDKLLEKLYAEKKFTDKMAKRKGLGKEKASEVVSVQRTIDKYLDGKKDLIGYKSDKEAASKSGSFKKGGKVKNKFKDNPEDRFGKYRSTTAKKGKMIKADELDDELGSPPGAENYQKMFDQPESMGGDPKKRIMPKKKPKEFKKKDAPVTTILEKSTREKIMKKLKGDTPLSDKLPFRGLSPLTRARDIIKRDQPKKKSKGGLIKGFPRLAKKGF